MSEESEAREELKRADHSIFVTLKYTKTCDVIKSTIHRLIGAFDYGIIHALTVLKGKKKLKDIPSTPISRAEMLKKTYRRTEITAFIKFYFLLRKIDRAKYSKKEEFRKNVALIATLEGGEVINVDIETLYSYFQKTKEFIDYIESKF
ncbi:MAG: hypothetical protein HY361_02130 [Candidatus Aenigmarchaeota archaeon]|nr:hypothetical protein [Candidatus Aenigmarchaeota archaeon]